VWILHLNGGKGSCADGKGPGLHYLFLREGEIMSDLAVFMLTSVVYVLRADATTPSRLLLLLKTAIGGMFLTMRTLAMER
jgi:hypothetical protein